MRERRMHLDVRRRSAVWNGPTLRWRLVRVRRDVVRERVLRRRDVPHLIDGDVWNRRRFMCRLQRDEGRPL